MKKQKARKQDMPSFLITAITIKFNYEHVCYMKRPIHIYPLIQDLG